MSSTKSTLSWREKLSYGIGAIGKDMVCGLIFTYAMIYFTDVLKISASFVGAVFFFAKFWDAVNDLGMGMIVDNTRTRWGKFRPWLLIGTLINAVVFVCLFTDWGLKGIPLYLFAAVMYVLWGMTYTIMDIPYWSMLPNLTQDKREREQVSVIPRIFASIGGSLLVAGFGLQIMDFLGKGDAQQGYTRFAWLIAIVFILTTLITVTQVTSADQDLQSEKKKEKTTFRQALHIIRQNDQLLVAIAVILAFNFATQVINGVATYYFIYVTESKTMFSVFFMFAGFAEIAGLFVFPLIVSRITRRQVYFLAAAFPTLGLSLLLIISYVAPANIFLTAIAGICVKLGSGLQLGTVTVVLADVVDYGEYKFGTRNESIIFSIQTLSVKFSSAIGALLTGFALDLTGYQPNVTQSDATLLGIRLVMTVVPIVFAIISYIVYSRCFKLDGEYYEHIVNVLKLRKTDTELIQEGTDVN